MRTKRSPVISGTNPGGDLTLMTVVQRFPTEESAWNYFESLCWPNIPMFPYCGNREAGRVYKVVTNSDKKIRAGLYKCAECEQGFPVTVGNVMEDTHLPLKKWPIAFYMMCGSNTQASALQLEIGSYAPLNSYPSHPLCAQGCRPSQSAQGHRGR
jgi:hypothetical protein